MSTQPKYAECCAILEIAPGASPAEVRKAYQRMLMIWHPDRFLPHSDLGAEAEAKTKAINEAYVVVLEHLLLENPPAAAPAPAPAPVPAPSPANAPRPFTPAPRAEPEQGRAPVWLWALGLAGAAGLFWAFWGFGKPTAPAVSPSVSPMPLPEGPPKPPPAPEEEKKPVPTLVVNEAAIIVFGPTLEEATAASPVKAADIARFRENERGFCAKLQGERPDLPLFRTDAEDIKLRDETIHRNETCGYGYILFSPPRRPEIRPGLRPIDEMLNYVYAFFPLAESGARSN